MIVEIIAIKYFSWHFYFIKTKTKLLQSSMVHWAFLHCFDLNWTLLMNNFLNRSPFPNYKQSKVSFDQRRLLLNSHLIFQYFNCARRFMSVNVVNLNERTCQYYSFHNYYHSTSFDVPHIRRPHWWHPWIK